MLKKIYHAALVCALALPPASGALAYERVCFELGAAGYVASFKWALGHRDNPDGLDPHWNGRNSRQGDGIGRIHAHQSGCFDLDFARPGDRLRFYVQAHGGNTVECGPGGGAGDDVEGHPGFWLMPDDPRGELVFWAKDGTTLNHWCARLRGELRMHSECNATFNGMSNAGCEPWAPPVTGSALHEIVDRGRGLGMLGSVLGRGGDVNRISRAHNDNSPLHIAAWRDRPEYARHLIRSGANLNSRNRQGSTPVLIATHYDNPTALRTLLDAGANANYPNDFGHFPLYIAAEKGNMEIARALVEGGAQVNAKHAQRDGATALKIAKQNRRTAMADYLRGVGAREEIYDDIIYDIVAEDRGISRLRDAINRGANVNVRGEDGMTALHLAASRNLSRYAGELLKDRDVDKELRDDDGRTPLMAAMEANASNSALVRALLTKGANANTPAASGDFPLYVAVRNGRSDLLRSLVYARGIDLNQLHSRDGVTALGLARSLRRESGGSGYDGIISALERRGAR